MSEQLPQEAEEAIAAIYARCAAEQPNFGVSIDVFRASLQKTVDKFLLSTGPASSAEICDLVNQIQADELLMAIACAAGNERAWWEFDQQHRAYLERVARHLAKTEADAQEVIDTVYVELYGTRVVDGERVSKFSTYSGRGSLRGWLRTVVWHSLVDLHRASHEEVSLDEITETIGEGAAHATFAEAAPGGEAEMIDHIARERYRKSTVTAIGNAFTALDDHERLLLLYYHVENLKLREIARLVENEASPLRGWFQRRSQSRQKNPSGRIHESTIMRWLERSYAKILELFRNELVEKQGFRPEEIDICMELATQDLAGNNLFRNLTA